MQIENLSYKTIVIWDSIDWDLGLARAGNQFLKEHGWRYAPKEHGWWKHKTGNPLSDVLALKAMEKKFTDDAIANGIVYTEEEGKRIDKEFLDIFDEII